MRAGYPVSQCGRACQALGRRGPELKRVCCGDAELPISGAIVFKLDNSELLPPSGLVDFVETRLEIDGRRCRITLDRVLSLEILGLPSRGVVGSLLSGLLNSNTCGFRMSE